MIGLGIDFTSCTMLPVDAAFEPLCLKAEYSNHPHAWVKLWKHHSTQEETDLLNRITLERNEPWLKRYGGKISSEWMLPKCLQILHEAPEIYRDAAYFIEAGDWIVAKLIGQLKRSGCMAGFKSFWHEAEGYPAPDFFAAVDPRLQSITDTKLSGEVVPLGNQAGTLLPHMAARLGLTPGLPVAISMIDAHAAVLGTGVCTPGKLVMVMGTSTCHLMLSEKEICVPGAELGGPHRRAVFVNDCPGYGFGRRAMEFRTIRNEKLRIERDNLNRTYSGERLPLCQSSNIDEFTETTSHGIQLIGGAKRGKAIIILNPAEPPVMMRDTVYALVEGQADESAIAASIAETVDYIRSYVPGYRLRTEPIIDGNKVSVFLEVEGAGDYLPSYSGNLDIMTASAVKVAEEVAKNRLSEAAVS